MKVKVTAGCHRPSRLDAIPDPACDLIGLLRPDLQARPLEAWQTVLKAFLKCRLLLTIPEDCSLTRQSEGTVYRQWQRGAGPKVVRCVGKGAGRGGRILIPLEEILAWRERHTAALDLETDEPGTGGDRGAATWRSRRAD